MFKSAATKVAHNPTIFSLAGNQDLRPLQDLITAEKSVIVSLEKLSADLSRASEALRAWGLGEGNDLENILSASTTIFAHFSSAISQYATHGHTMREQLKAIRTREENLNESKRRRQGVLSKVDSADKKLSKMRAERKNLSQQTELLQRLRQEFSQLHVEVIKEEAAIGDFKRSMTRSWMGLKFGGLLECCEKGKIAGKFGKLVISEIPEDETQPGTLRKPYSSLTKVGDLVAEAHRCVDEVHLSTVPSAPKPQVPSPSDLPLNQGGFTSSQSTTDTYSGNTRHDFHFLPEPQELGVGRFLYSPTNPTAGTFNQQPQHYASSPSLSTVQSGVSRRLDEFGFTGDPVGTPTADGSRFVTFPVKERSGSAGTVDSYRFHNTTSIPSAGHGPAGSLSSSAAPTLAISERASQENPTPLVGKLSQHYQDEPAPAYESDPENSQQLGPTHHRRILLAGGPYQADLGVVRR